MYKDLDLSLLNPNMEVHDLANDHMGDQLGNNVIQEIIDGLIVK